MMKSKFALIGILILAMVTFGGVYLLNRSQQPRPDPFIATLIATQNAAPVVVPTAIPLDTALLAEDPVVEDVNTAADFDPVRLEVETTSIRVDVRSVGVNSQGFVVTPSRSAGYWIASTKLNEMGNIVIVGHNRDEPIEIFRNLSQVQIEDKIVLTDAKAREYPFVIKEIHIIEVENAPAGEAARVVEFMNDQPTDSQKLTLVSCHPAPTCPDRIVIIAEPVDLVTN